MNLCIKSIFVFSALLSLNVFSAEPAHNEALVMAPSFWAGWMRGNVVVDGQKADIVRESGNLFGDLSYGGSMELGLRNKKMVVLGLVDYFDGITSEVEVGGQRGTLESSEIIGCIAVGYPFAGTGKTSMDFLVGLQGMRMENDLKVSGSRSKSSTDVYDPVFMLRIKFQLGTRFYLHIPLTFGGSYLGDSELVYDAGAQFLYQFTDLFDIRAGYRISGHDYQDDDNNKWDFYQQGYTLGLGLTF